MFGGLGKFLFGDSGSTEKLPALTGEQSQFLKQLFGMLNIKDFDLGNSELFGEGSDQLMKMLQGDTSLIEQPLMDQYQNEILPGIANRFGGLGAQGSSGYQNALAQAGGNLASQLGQMRYGAKQSALDHALQYSGARNQSLQGLAGLGLGTKQFGYQQNAPKYGLTDALSYGVGGGFGEGIGSGFSNYIKKKFGG